MCLYSDCGLLGYDTVHTRKSLTNVSEEPAAYIFRIDEGEGTMFLWNLGVIAHKTNLNLQRRDKFESNTNIA
jgi:hypothetical protein